MNVILPYRLKNTIASDLESHSTLKGQITINQLIGLFIIQNITLSCILKCKHTYRYSIPVVCIN